MGDGPHTRHGPSNTSSAVRVTRTLQASMRVSPAHWPGGRSAPPQEERRPAVLLRLGGGCRVALSADARPRSERELVLAAEGAAAADRTRVAVRLAGGDPLERRFDARREPGFSC